MNVDKHIHVTLSNHVNDVRYSLEPGWVDIIIRSFSGEMICPSYFDDIMVSLELIRAFLRMSYLAVECP